MISIMVLLPLLLSLHFILVTLAAVLASVLPASARQITFSPSSTAGAHPSTPLTRPFARWPRMTTMVSASLRVLHRVAPMAAQDSFSSQNALKTHRQPSRAARFVCWTTGLGAQASTLTRMGMSMMVFASTPRILQRSPVRARTRTSQNRRIKSDTDRQERTERAAIPAPDLSALTAELLASFITALI